MHLLFLRKPARRGVPAYRRRQDNVSLNVCTYYVYISTYLTLFYYTYLVYSRGAALGKTGKTIARIGKLINTWFSVLVKFGWANPTLPTLPTLATQFQFNSIFTLNHWRKITFSMFLAFVGLQQPLLAFLAFFGL